MSTAEENALAFLTDRRGDATQRRTCRDAASSQKPFGAFFNMISIGLDGRYGGDSLFDALRVSDR